ncbi:acyltransferase family protein [Rhizobium sp. NLR22b]|uniref:acyltransferase family protein n=1 Tax=Rhizobium sp. NLR22b TaxID=2731115 RepID=UPI001C83783F|nr:acyltransferase family protein [Rhizobium sp. NLR22b]MBX5242173.1 acyltransferase [Rhizobium sp. NLR22b]
MHNNPVRAYRPDIDGLRSVAVISVVLFHAGLRSFSGGFVGVDIFFVISGYLITGHIYGDILKSEFKFTRFYARRARRILPALFFVLAVSFLIGFLLLSPGEFRKFSHSAVAAMLGFSNVYYWLSSNYFSPASDQLPMLMTWSLGVEEQFYMVFPWIILFLNRYFKQAILPAIATLVVLSFIFSVAALKINPAFTFYLLPTRAWELGIGGILAVMETKGLRLDRGGSAVVNAIALIGAILVVLPICVYNDSTPFPGAAALLPVLGSALLIATPSSMVAFALGSRPFVFIGLVSYSWYLWHWPLLSFASVASVWPLPQSTALLIVGTSFILAVLTYYLVEKPFRRPGLSNGRTLWRYAAALAVFAFPFALTALLAGVPQRFGSQVARIEQIAGGREACLVSYGATSPALGSNCQPAGNTEPAIALIGDSHAAALAPGLRAIAQERGYQLYVFTKTSCPPLTSATRYMPNHPLHAAECSAYNAKVLGLLRENDAIKKVILAGYWSAPMREAETGSRYISPGANGAEQAENQNGPTLESALASQIAQLRAMNKDVVLLQDVPLFNFNPVRAVLQRAIPFRAAFGGWLDGDRNLTPYDAPMKAVANFDDPVRDIITRVAEKSPPGVILVDPFSALCPRARCSFSTADGAPLFIDNQHLSTVGSEVAARAVLPADDEEKMRTTSFSDKQSRVTGIVRHIDMPVR